MSPSAKKVLEEALHLGETERASIAGALIESLHGPAEPGVEEAWEVEIERRIRELENGAVETVPWSEVRARLFDGFE
jgi:putative addiction module component (TIGR02574 family)